MSTTFIVPSNIFSGLKYTEGEDLSSLQKIKLLSIACRVGIIWTGWEFPPTQYFWHVRSWEIWETRTIFNEETDQFEANSAFISLTEKYKTPTRSGITELIPIWLCGAPLIPVTG